MALVFLSVSALVLSMVKMSTKQLRKLSFVVKGVHEVRAWSPSGPSCGYHHKSWWNMKDGTTFEGSVRSAVGMVPLSLTEGVQRMRSWHQRGLTHVATDKISFHNWCCACPFVGNRKKVVRCLHDFLGKSVPSSVKFLGRAWRMDLYPHGDELHLGFRLRGQISISNA